MKMQILVFSILTFISVVAFNNCAKNGFDLAASQTTSSGGSAAPLRILGNEPNVMKLTVGCEYINQPCVSVTICEPGTSNCQTIDKILLDTGSYGLRVFSSLVNLNLSQRNIGSTPLAECVTYADGSSNWGPIKGADVVLGGLKAPNIPIQIIDSTYASVPGDCSNPDSSPAAAGYNGILGVGLFTEDCGAGCATVAENRIYFACNGTNCNSTAVPINQQVVNPVSFLPTDNNGVIVQLPAIPSAGSTSASGYVVLGIGTQANNTPASAKFFQADAKGYFKTQFNGSIYPNSFIDSGSNGYFFPSSSGLSLCSSSSGANGFFCPSAPLVLTATQISGSGAPLSVTVSFEIQNAVDAIINSPNFMFNNIGGNFPTAFDWGMPFYFGRTVFHGIEGKSSALGTGPYWAW